MATVSGACVISKVSGLLQIREDTTPSKLIWKAIDQDKSLEIPLNNLDKLQVSKETSPKMLLKLYYAEGGNPEIKDIKLTFNNRQTMHAVKDILQTILARQKTVIKDSPAPASDSGASALGTPAPTGTSSNGQSPAPGDPFDFSSQESLSDSALMKNRQLQQKLLLEDKSLRNIFTQSVIKFKLSPAIFWSSRVSQLRTYALTISQHRGPYNVLSTIRPVATSDNQVNVNVTRDTINEIFETYPVIKRAFNELVPVKLNEGEFWSRFFNSKLFRRLRGDKINIANSRGDVVIDKYLYVDADFVEEEEKSKNLTETPGEGKAVKKFIDLFGNEADNSQKLGISPDFTMKFLDEDAANTGSQVRNEPRSHKNENEMMILMKNMNKLSSKMVTINSSEASEPTGDKKIYEELEEELDIADLNEAEKLNYIELNIDTQAARHSMHLQKESTLPEDSASDEAVASFLSGNVFSSASQVDLRETYASKTDDISKAYHDITALVKYNFRIFKLVHNVKDTNQSSGEKILSDEEVQELITFNITIMEFLLHFWNLFLNGGNPVQLKKLFTNIRNCESTLNNMKKKLTDQILEHPLVKLNDKLRDKLLKDLDNCIFPMSSGLTKASNDYMTAVRAANQSEKNENGKRPLPVENP
ncbi:CIC11C00000005092 [Sungouiella intermedia]|uniref:CIC11C00000005092 n=1 Tax=Sungouiella intermedia TaxID=45354 RepID=A0A1L0C1T7_9ASCO|nr:CIC11C00000005092 [[Candida] intermedia]